MISIIEHIEYLMISNDCMVIPGWGAFIAQYASSHFPTGSSLIEKPSRKISFNASINHNDGLLANSIVKKHGVSYTEACKIINDNVAIYKQLLVEGSEIPFGHLGYFASTTDGRIEFIPFYHEYNNNDYFGINTFTFSTLAESHQQEEVNENQEISSNQEVEFLEESETKHNWFTKKALKIAASIIVLIGLTGVLTTPIVIDKQNQELATLTVPEVKKQQPTAAKQPVAKQKEISEKDSIEQLMLQQIAEYQKQQNLIQEQIAQAQQNQVPGQAANAIKGHYALIIATAVSQQQANLYIMYNKDLSGKACVINKGGQYYVCYDSSNDYAALVSEAQSMPSQFSQWWILPI